MKKINRKLTCSVMAVVLGGIVGMGAMMPRAEAENTNIVNGSSAKGALQSYDSKYNTPLSYATKDGAVALGVGSYATAKYSFAMGDYVYAGGMGAVAFGKGVKDDSTGLASSNYGALGAQSFVAGNATTAKGSYSFAMGKKSIASGMASVAMGCNSFASGSYSVAMGDTSVAYGDCDVAMGKSAQTGAKYNAGTEETPDWKYVGGRYAVAMGEGAKAYANGSVAFGSSTAGAISGTDGGTSAVTVTSGIYAFAAGYQSTASGSYSVAMGNGAVATPNNSFAFGGTVGSAATAGIALGYLSSVTGANSVALGDGSVATDAKEVSVGKSGDGGFTRKITNVTSAGTLSSTNTNAATGADVYAATYITDAHNYYNGSSTAVNVKTAVNAIDTAMGKLSANGYYIKSAKNVYENIGLLDSQANTNAGNITTLQGYFTEGKANEALKASKDGAGNVIADTYATKSAFDTLSGTVTGYGTYITSSGLNANSKQITAVAAGTNDTDAVNYGQVKGAYSSATYSDNKLTLTKIDGTQTQLTIGGGSGGTSFFEADGTNVKLSGDGSKQITNVASAGALSSTNTNAATGADVYAATTLTSAGKFYVANDSVITAIGKVDTQVNANKTAIETLNGGETTTGSVENKIKTAFDSKVGALSTDGNYIKQANTVSANLSTLDTKIGTISAGTYKAIKTDNSVSANLIALDTQVDTNAKDIATLKNTGITADKVTQIETNKNNITANKNSIDAIQTYVTSNGLNANSKKIVGVAAGEAVTDAANLGQIQSYSTIKIGETNVNSGTGVQFVAGDNVSLSTNGNIITIAAKSGSSGKGGETSTIVGKDNEANAGKSTAMGYGNKVSGENSTAVGIGNVVKGKKSGAFGDPSYIYGSGSYSVGNNNIIGLDGNTTVGNNTFVLGSDVATTVNNSVILGAGSTATEDNVVSVGSETQQRKIVNVAPGENPYDAVNYAQYSDLANNMNRRFSQVNEDIGRTGAASAALASLHPQMMRKGESQVMAGMGRYHGKSGAAVGLAWQPHKRIMLSGGFADAAGEIMFNFGASYKFGQHSYTAEQLAEINNGTGLPLYVAELNAVLKSKDVQIMNLKSEFGKEIQTKNVEIQDLRNKVDKLEAMMAELMNTRK